MITPEVRAVISGMPAFAPLHVGAEMEGMKIVDNLLGVVSHVAVFDTGFHSQMPLSAAVFPGPYAWFESGIRRYGFHGINHQYCAACAAQLLGKQALRVVTCHLGNGCSLAAINDGRSIDTTMGFTLLDGLMMGTRSGAMDPGILTYLMRQSQLNAEEIDSTLNHKSGLPGISGFPATRAIFWQLIGVAITAGVGENSPEDAGRLAAHLALSVFISIQSECPAHSRPGHFCRGFTRPRPGDKSGRRLGDR